MNHEYDVVVAGSGFAGSLTAMIAKRLGRSVALIERGRHPRFAIGESSTPLANLLLDELARRYHLPRLLPLAKWGTWQRERSAIACGLKRGFSFFHHRFGEPYCVDEHRHRQLLVAASPHDDIADTHWFREDLDAFFVEEARQLGVDYSDRVSVKSVDLNSGGSTLRGQRNGEAITLRARFLVDATGPRGLLHQIFNLAELPFGTCPDTAALFTHFRGVKRFEEIETSPVDPPYPPDDAAVHHIFPGGWIWVLRFINGVVSAGVSMERTLADELNLSEGRPAWDRLLARLPSVREQFADAVECRPFVHQRRVAFRSGQMIGPRWAMLPSASGFVDPLLSTGIPLTLLGIDRLARLWESPTAKEISEEELAAYVNQTNLELEVTAELIGALFAWLGDPEVFNALAQIYFAAASYAESARRLGRFELAPGFLLCGRAGFSEPIRKLLALAREDRGREMRERLLTGICDLIAPFNIAGLANPERRNWYPVRGEDLIAAAAKLDSSPEDVRQMLAACGMDLVAS